MLNHRCLFPWALVTALTGSLTAEAAEWLAEPSVTLRGEYDDNLRLTALPHDDVWSSILDPRLALRRRSELWDLSANGRLRATSYSGDDSLDNTVDNFLDIAVTRHLERGSVDLSAALINDTTLQNETLDFDTGLTIFQLDRTQRNLRLAGNYLFTETNWIEASVAYTELEYDQSERFGLYDYNYLIPGLRVVHQYDPQTQIFGILTHSKVDYDRADALESTTDSLQVGAAYDITETWKVSGSVGSRRTSTSSVVPTAVPLPGLEFLFPFIYDVVYVPSDAESTGLVYDASLTREFETGYLSLKGSQSVTPSSTGTNAESLSISLNGTRRFSATLSAELAVSYYQSSTVGGVTTRADYDRSRITPKLTWRLDKDLTLNTGYTYTRIQRELSNNDTADSNAVFISLGYTWPPMSTSR